MSVNKSTNVSLGASASELVNGGVPWVEVMAWVQRGQREMLEADVSMIVGLGWASRNSNPSGSTEATRSPLGDFGGSTATG